MKFGSWMLSGVLREEATADGGEGGGTGAVADAQPDVKALEAKIAELEAQKTEADKSARYWHEQAKGAKPADKSTQQEAVDDDDPFEVLSKKGVKGFDELLAKRGFVRADDVDKAVNAKAQQIATENELARNYPELQDTTSEFFKATAVHYKALIQSGVSPNLAMKFAAEKTELEGYKTGKRLSPAEKAEREARAKAQGGGEKGKKQAPAEEEGTGELDDFQKYICEAMEITPEQYQKRAKDGVRVGGRQ